MSDNNLMEKIQGYGVRKSRNESDLLNTSLDISYKVSSSPRFKHKMSPFQQSPVVQQSPHNISNSLDQYQFELPQGKDPQSEIKFLLSIIDQLQMDLQLQMEENNYLKQQFEGLLRQVKMQNDSIEQREYLDQLEKTNKQLLQEINILRRNMQDTQNKCHDYQRDLDNLKVNASELLIQNEGLYSLLNSLKEKHVFDIESQAKHLDLISQKKIDDEITLLQRQYKREIDTQNSISDNYKKKVDDLVNECEIKSKMIAQQKEQELKQCLQIELLNGKLQRFQKLEQELINMESLLNCKNKQWQQTVDENNQISEELKHIKQQNSIIEQNFRQQQIIFENEREELHQRIEQLQQKEDEISKTNTDFKKKEMDQHKLLKQIQDLGDENIKLLEQNTFILDKTNDTETLRVNYKNLVRRYYKMKQENEYLSQSINQQITNISVLQHQIHLISTEKNELIAALHHTQQQILQQQAYYNKCI